MESPIKMDDLGGTTIFGNIQILNDCMEQIHTSLDG